MEIQQTSHPLKACQGRTAAFGGSGEKTGIVLLKTDRYGGLHLINARLYSRSTHSGETVAHSFATHTACKPIRPQRY